MKLDYELTKQDYIAYNLFHMTYSKTARRLLRMQRYLIPVIFLLLPFFIARVSDIPLWYWMITFLITSIVWIFLFPKRMQKNIAGRVSKGLLGKRSLSLTEEGILEISESRESKSKWDAVENLVETQEYIFIYISSIMAYVIPSRAFTSEAERNEFIGIVKARQGKSE